MEAALLRQLAFYQGNARASWTGKEFVQEARQKADATSRALEKLHADHAEWERKKAKK